MFKRFVAVAIIVMLPMAALAEADSANLGAQGSLPSGASTSLNGVLQPGATQGLQNGTGGGNSNTIQGDSAQTLQGSIPTSLELEVIKGDADGAPVTPEENTGEGWKLASALVALGLIAATGMVVLRRSQR